MRDDPNLNDREYAKQYLLGRVIRFDLIVLINKIRDILEDETYYEPQAQGKIDAIERAFAEMGLPLNLDHPWNQHRSWSKRGRPHHPSEDA
jgi:hypothetical protein